MICLVCKKDRDSKDYYKSNICYKCVYNEKMKRYKREKKCRICGKKISKTRWTFCSNECAEKNEYKPHWTKDFIYLNRSMKNHPWKS